VTVAVVTLRPVLLNSVDKVLILRAGRAEAFGRPGDVLHRVVPAAAAASPARPEARQQTGHAPAAARRPE
jgi:ATP-binding cassette, subfamily C, bacterial